MSTRGMRIFHIMVIGVALIVASCGSSGPRMISNRGGDVERGELLFDEITAAPDLGEYLINYGDELDVSFFYNEDYNLTGIKVRPDGNISLPYIGEVRAAGRSVSQVDSVITDAYASIIREPQISVILKEFDEPVVYILGEVTSPGAYELLQGMTLLGALSQGKFDMKRGKKSSILVIRRVSHDHIVGMQFDIRELTEGGRFDLDIPLQTNDIIYVPTSSLKKAEDFINSMYYILNNPMNIYLRGWQIANVQVLYDFYRRAGQTY